MLLTVAFSLFNCIYLDGHLPLPMSTTAVQAYLSAL